MSLSRILNDEPAPSLSLRPVHAAPMSNIHDRSRMEISPTSTSGGKSPLYPHPPRSERPDPRGEPAPYGYPYVEHRGTTGSDPYAGEWVQRETYPFVPGGSYHPDSERHPSRYSSPDDPRELSPPSRHNHGDGEATPKRRRRGRDQDEDYEPPGPKRLSPRKYPPTKQIRPPSPVASEMEFHVEGHAHAVEDDALLNSDLDDCREIWEQELEDYIRETQKRQNQVEKWFEASVLERNSKVALEMSRYYQIKISKIPVPPPRPPTPPPPPPRVVDLSPAMRPLSPRPAHFDEEYPDMEPADFGPSYPLEDRMHPALDASSHELDEMHAMQYIGLPGPGLGPRDKGKGKDTGKRPASGAVSDGSSNHDEALKEKVVPATKRRRLDRNLPVPDNEPGPSQVPDNESVTNGRSIASAVKGKGKGKQRELSHDSISITIKPPRKKPGPRKKIDTLPTETLELLGLTAGPASLSGDVTPVVSRPASPALPLHAIVYDLGEPIPPLKKAKKVDDHAMMKRIKTLEESQRKVWTNIARRDVAKVYKYHSTGYQIRQAQLERLARFASIQARRPFTKTPKANKDIQAKSRRLMREMQVFWKKNEREERDVRKREQKEATDRAKIEEEKREAARQARKLEFLISQTELYSHFVGNKLKTSEVQGDADGVVVPVGADVEDVDPESLQDIDFDDDDPTNLHRHAKHNAQEAIALAKQRAQQFDTQAALERKTNEALKLAKGQASVRDDVDEEPAEPTTSGLVDLDSDELNFQNPTSLSGPLKIGQPNMLMAQLKEYQLKGLNWLATLYEQGINGILADEMGLGKTVQSISLLAYLAEVHDIWGPFLVVAPASTLHNWQQELTRFVPGLKALPYWGNVKDRTTLRKFWSKKEISYDKDAPFHVLITSYQLVTQDQQYFQRVKWQYMILDEAQNIKNSSSVRWKTLLGFHCRNRLLLTGTPIQNNMQELWALLHFIMPSLFDSHDEFNEWFSKDIESAAENKGSKLNEHQLRRLHMILKPFMLRRVKRHVQNELSEKIEKDIYVDLSARQRALYKALLANVSVADLLEKAANIGDADSARSLMNLVMQFRKVCNHPELFERADVVAPFAFCQYGRSGPLIREGDFISLSYSTRNPISVTIPELLYQNGGLLDVPCETSSATSRSSLAKLMSIWSTDWIHHSLYDDIPSAFSFLRLLGLTSQDAHSLHTSPLLHNRLLALQEDAKASEDSPYYSDPMFVASTARSPLQITSRLALRCLNVAEGLPNVSAITRSTWAESCLSRPQLQWFIPAAVAPPISMYCADRTFLERQAQVLEAPLESLALYGLTSSLADSEEGCALYRSQLPGLSCAGLVGDSPPDQLPLSTMQVPEAKRLIYDSAKLARLDTLLQELKAGDHRVLVYFQMTRMMDLMEEYLIYRQYKYLRLDGSSKLEDRRDMVIDWQTRPDIFVFLLSTRAGGLGINLTAADTVVFYDHDWNPSNDAQAMDRAHRLGQTRQVTVYRLITKGTIDERIVQLARVKKDVQDIVVGNKNFTDVTKPSEIVQLLLNDEQLATLDTSAATGLSEKQAGKQPERMSEATDEPIRDLWNDEGDDFFGHSTAAGNGSAVIADAVDDETGTPGPITTSTRGKKRRPGGTGAPRGRKPGKAKAGTLGDGA